MLPQRCVPVYKDDFKAGRRQQECHVKTLQWVSDVNRLNSLLVPSYLSLGHHLSTAHSPGEFRNEDLYKLAIISFIFLRNEPEGSFVPLEICQRSPMH